MKYFIGFLAGAIITLFATGEVILNSQDRIVRLQEQVAHCPTAGDYPSLHDILGEPSNQ